MAGDKFLYNNAGTLTEKRATDVSAGAGDAGKIIALNSTGQLDSTMLPTGVGPDTGVLPATEALAAGDFVNVYNAAGTPSVRKADASTTGKQAHGYVLAAVSNGANATVYFDGRNTAVTAQVAGNVFLSASTPGKPTATAPSTGGQIVQPLGVAVSATEINVEVGQPVVLVA